MHIFRWPSKAFNQTEKDTKQKFSSVHKNDILKQNSYITVVPNGI